MKKYIIIIIALVALVIFKTQNVVANAETQVSQKFIDQVGTNLITQSKQITFVGPRSGEGYFSADGTKMIYQSEREEGNPFYQMFLLDLSSGKSTRLSPGNGMTTCGWVHPNLKKAMWSSTHLDPKISDKVKAEYEERAKPVKKRYSWSYDDSYDIFESDLAGKHIKRLTKELGYDAEGSYSPDGKYIAFASNRTAYNSKDYTPEEKKIIEHDPSYAMEIYIMKADGSDVKRLTNSKGYDGGPFFSADGSKITWRRFTPDGSRAEIYTMNLDGSDQRQITQLDVLSWAPYFHPSGRYIIFTSSLLGYNNFELFIVDAEANSKPIRVSFEEGFDGLPTFSPDGKKISWTHRNEKGESQIYLAEWNHQAALDLIEKNQYIKKTNLELSSSINEHDASEIVHYLASDAFKGRQTGSSEEQIYTAKFVELFKKWGLRPAIGSSFVHTFEYIDEVSAGKQNNLSLRGRVERPLKLGEDYQLSSFSKSGEIAAAPLVFAGFGISAPATEKVPEYNSYRDLDVKNKWVVIFEYMPTSSDKEVKQHLVSYSQLQSKVTVAKNNHALGVIVVTETGLNELRFDGSFAESSIPVVRISSKLFTEILAKSESQYKTYSQLWTAFDEMKSNVGFNLNSQYLDGHIDLVYHHATGRNVVGVLFPKNIKKATKGLIIGAHGDHLGNGSKLGTSLARSDEKGKFHYGADDNASGVSGVLELAHYFSQSNVLNQIKKPLYFAIWSGEESGVIGSSVFVKDWETITKKKINDKLEGALNMDMIGRLKDRIQVQGVGSAKQWTGLTEEVSLVSGAPLTLVKDPYLPTDSISFYMAEIPSISFMTSTHEDYHTPRDTADKINYKGLVKIVEIVKTFIEKLSTVQTKLLAYEKVEGDATKNMQGRSFRIYLGTIPDYSQEGVKGVRISGTTKNSPAETAGLKTGDVIVEFDSLKIENLYDYVYALQSAKPDKAVKLSVLRLEKRVDLEITPVLKDK